MPKVYVASLSPIKVSAVSEVVGELLSGHFEVHGLHTESGIDDQPVGLEETFTGANNRVTHAKTLVTDSYLFIIGIENGIVQVGGKWVDLAVVLVSNAEGDTFLSTSTGVVFDTKYVEMAKEKGFDKHTVGSIMAKAYGKGCSSTDPHEYLTSGAVPRKATLIQAVKVAVSQALRSSK
eukprot:Phypoly_transcript_21883.p1 GENE.Phypoly_transcript_21883~~Phypoly_transcript_21883.p1  ORF type:complete len:178 (+),score=25.93 Phypoly_transcript_21883:21-554(+)